MALFNRPFHQIVIRLVPACMLVGASMELFMIQTGFYDIVTKKEAERRIEQMKEREELAKQMEEARRKQLG